MNWLKSLFGFLSNPIADLTGSYRERKRISAEMAADVATAENNLKIARFNAKAKRLENQDLHDVDYDTQVLRNRAESIMDNIVIVVFLGLMIAHFIPYTQPFMLSGWKSMGYSGAPWYFEFVIIGIAVSTLGLMRLFRLFIDRIRKPI